MSNRTRLRDYHIKSRMPDGRMKEQWIQARDKGEAKKIAASRLSAGPWHHKGEAACSECGQPDHGGGMCNGCYARVVGEREEGGRP